MVETYQSRARHGDVLAKEIRNSGFTSDLRSPLFRPEFLEHLNDELRLDADAMARSELFWVSASMSDLAHEYSDSDAPWRPAVEAPADFGLLLFESAPPLLTPLPPHGVPTLDGDMFGSWAPEEDLPPGLPKVPLAGFRWALRGDVIDISFYVRRENLKEVFKEADAAGDYLHPREVVDKGWVDRNGHEAISILPETVRWMDTYTLDSESVLIEWDRAEISAHEDFSVIETPRMKLAGANIANALWLAGSIVPSVWTMMKSEKVALTSRNRITRKVKSLGGSRVTTLIDDVSIIDVRPYQFKPHSETGTGRKISVRFLVRGHMTTVWTGKGKTTPQRRFIAPYWKGSPDMPIKAGERVNIVR